MLEIFATIAVLVMCFIPGLSIIACAVVGYMLAGVIGATVGFVVGCTLTGIAAAGTC